MHAVRTVKVSLELVLSKESPRIPDPRSTKTSTRDSHRPPVLSVYPKRRRAVLDWYFTIYFTYRVASEAYRGGKRNTNFPPGSYKPYVPTHYSGPAGIKNSPLTNEIIVSIEPLHSNCDF